MSNSIQDQMAEALRRKNEAQEAERRRLAIENANQREIAEADAEIKRLQGQAAQQVHQQKHQQNAAIVQAYEAECKAMLSALDDIMAALTPAVEKWQAAVNLHGQQRFHVFGGREPMPPPGLMFAGDLSAYWQQQTGFQMPSNVGQFLSNWINQGEPGERVRRRHVVSALVNRRLEDGG